jgi:hypothetical protein
MVSNALSTRQSKYSLFVLNAMIYFTGIGENQDRGMEILTPTVQLIS